MHLFPMYTSDTAPLSGLLIETTDEDDSVGDLSTSSGRSSVAPHINGMKSHPIGTIIANQAAHVSSAKSMTSAVGCVDNEKENCNLTVKDPYFHSARYDDVESVPSDELLALKQLSQQLAAPVAQSNMILASQSVGWCHGMQGRER